MKYIEAVLLGVVLASGALCLPVDEPSQKDGRDDEEGCPAPAPLLGEPVPGAPGYIVVSTGPSETERLTARYALIPAVVDIESGRFRADLSPELVAALRCEPGVTAIAYNWVMDPVTLCPDPVPLVGVPDPATRGRFIVRLHDGTDGPAETGRLAAVHGFVPGHIFQSFPGFSAELSAAIVTALRCETSVWTIEYENANHPTTHQSFHTK